MVTITFLFIKKNYQIFSIIFFSSANYTKVRVKNKQNWIITVKKVRKKINENEWVKIFRR